MLTVLICLIYLWTGYLWWKKLFWHDDLDSYFYVDRIPVYMIIWPLSVLLFLFYKIVSKLKGDTKAD